MERSAIGCADDRRRIIRVDFLERCASYLSTSYALYDEVVFPSLCASNADLYSNIEEDDINNIKVSEIKTYNIKGIDIVVESLTELRNDLENIL